MRLTGEEIKKLWAEFDGQVVPFARAVIAAHDEELRKQEPCAHMYPSDLERFQEEETFAHAYSVAVGNPSETSVPVYLSPIPPTGWQPIETAPMDGTEIDVWCPSNAEGDDGGYRVSDVWWSDVGNKWRVRGDEAIAWIHCPTHWMPLPARPEGEKK